MATNVERGIARRIGDRRRSRDRDMRIERCPADSTHDEWRVANVGTANDANAGASGARIQRLPFEDSRLESCRGHAVLV
jgi:hypothetical protein